MIAKKKLLQAIDEALRTEERVIGIYAVHCAISAQLTEIPATKLEPFGETVIRLRDESRGHRDLLEGMRRKIVEDPRHAF